MQGASEVQRTKMNGKELVFAELAVPLATGVRSLLGRTPAHQASKSDDALLVLLSRPNSKRLLTKGKTGNDLADEDANNSYDLLFDGIVDELASQLLICS